MAESASFRLLMDCYMALNNLLPSVSPDGELLDDELDVDCQARVSALLHSYQAVLDSGYLDQGADFLSGNAPVECCGLVESSYSRVLCRHAAEALGRVFALVSDRPVAFHAYGPEDHSGDNEALAKLPWSVVTTAASGGQITRALLEEVRRQFAAEFETRGGAELGRNPPITWSALYELCVGRFNRVGQKVAGSDSTVRGWKNAKGFPPEMTWNAVRNWLNSTKDYDIGPPPDEC